MTKHITQREARDFRRRLKLLEDTEDRRRNAWADTWIGGANIATTRVEESVQSAVRTARMLKHAVIATLSSDGSLRLHALPLGSDAE